MSQTMMKRICCVLCAAIFFTMIVGAPTAAARIVGMEPRVKTAVAEISREMFVTDLAAARGLSYKEADQLEQAGHWADVQKEVSARTVHSGESVTPKETRYITVSEIVAEESGGTFRYAVRAVVHMRAERYTSSTYGDYQKWSEIIHAKILLEAPGEHKWGDGTFDVYLIDVDGYSNKIEILGSGIVSCTGNRRASEDAEPLGFGVYKEENGNYICSKYLEFDLEVGSNTYLS